MAAAAAVTSMFATAVLLIICIAASAAAQDAPTGSPPGVETGCLSTLVNASDCLAFVEEGNNLTAPASACCAELAGLVENNLFCLCQVLRRADRLGAKINASRMIELPAACDISTPTDALCSVDRDPFGGGIGPIIFAPTTDSGPEIENNGSYGVRTTDRALSALAIVGVALPTLFLASLG